MKILLARMEGVRVYIRVALWWVAKMTSSISLDFKMYYNAFETKQRRHTDKGGIHLATEELAAICGTLPQKDKQEEQLMCFNRYTVYSTKVIRGGGKSFKTSKELVVPSQFLVHYGMNKLLVLTCDDSSQRAWVHQSRGHGWTRAPCLSNHRKRPQRNYAQTDR